MTNDERDRMLRIYLNRSRTDKIPKDASQEVWREFHSHWQPMEVTARQMAVEIYKGYSIAHLHNGRKTKDHWQEAWFVALDFESGDERSSLDYLAEQDLINTFASFAYTTPSHCKEDPRARVVWVFDQPITDLDYYEELYRALLAEFSWADHSTKDATRFFYGNTKCTVWANWSILPKPSYDYIVKRWHAEKPKEEEVTVTIPPSDNGNYERYVEAALKSECENVERAPDNHRHDARFTAAIALGSLVGASWAGLDRQTAFSALLSSALKNTNTPRADIERVINDGLERGISSPRSEPVRTVALREV